MPVLWVRVQRLSDTTQTPRRQKEPDAVVANDVVVADVDAAAMRDLQGPDYFENVAQEQQGPARRQRRQPERFRDDAGPGLGLNLLSYRPTGLLLLDN